MNLAELDGKPFTLWLTDNNDESAVFSGIARWDGATFQVEREPNSPFEIRPEWYDRIQIVRNEETRKTLLGADYFLRLYVGDVPQGATAGEYVQTGLKWPE